MGNTFSTLGIEQVNFPGRWLTWANTFSSILETLGSNNHEQGHCSACFVLLFGVQHCLHPLWETVHGIRGLSILRLSGTSPLFSLSSDVLGEPILSNSGQRSRASYVACMIRAPAPSHHDPLGFKGHQGIHSDEHYRARLQRSPSSDNNDCNVDESRAVHRCIRDEEEKEWMVHPQEAQYHHQGGRFQRELRRQKEACMLGRSKRHASEPAPPQPRVKQGRIGVPSKAAVLIISSFQYGQMFVKHVKKCQESPRDPQLRYNAKLQAVDDHQDEA